MKTFARSASRLAFLTSIVLVSSPSAAQEASSPLEEHAARTGETVRFVAAGAAATQALNLCSGMWQGGLTNEIIARDLNAFDPILGAGLLPEDAEVVIDDEARTVSITYDPAMPPRHVVWRPVLGCVQLPIGASLESARYLPRVGDDVRAPDLDAEPWPMGDREALAQLPRDRKAALDEVVAAAFDNAAYGGKTWAVIVVADGKIVAERYGRGLDMHMSSQTHSAAKSFTSSLIGIATREGLLNPQDPAPIAAWQTPGDPRGEITIEHLLRMSSGLYVQGHGSPVQKIYSMGGTVQDLDATNILDGKPGSTFVYSPPDTMLLMRSIREAMNDDAAFWAFPYRELYWRIGMTRTTSNGDWNGDFMLSGQTWSSARDFARFGLLYLNDGVWQGERILPEGWRDYVTTKGPAQPPRPPYYGAQFWLAGGMEGLPEDAFTPRGGRGHFAMIIPSRNAVVVRRGFDDPDSGFRIERFSADVLEALGR